MPIVCCSYTFVINAFWLPMHTVCCHCLLAIDACIDRCTDTSLSVHVRHRCFLVDDTSFMIHCWHTFTNHALLVADAYSSLPVCIRNQRSLVANERIWLPVHVRYRCSLVVDAHILLPVHVHHLCFLVDDM